MPVPRLTGKRGSQPSAVRSRPIRPWPSSPCACEYAYLRQVPNMVVIAPKDENELQHMVKTCLSYEGPASVRYSRGSAWGVPMDPTPKALPIGKAELLREGYDVGVVAIGIM